ncbi:glycosyltransferase [Hymenobacter lapidarius]|uniref:glycosyltransferase n=1 Tax=Hymenobacter lapidarius TaxID=1908237 RepID=UPI000F7AE3BA|nr:glycosyltransferase [Hymenobacter lapidarius]
MVTQNKDLALATLSKQLMGGVLRVIYQQHMQLGRPKRSLVHRLRFGQLDAWLTPLPGLGQEVLRSTHLEARRLHVVPLGLPVEQFAPPARTRSQARQELTLPAQGLLLGILGRFDRGKGQDFVLEALHLLRSEYGHDAGLLVMGAPSRNEGDTYYQQLQQQVARLGLAAEVHFRGFRPNPDVFYQAIDFSVMARLTAW